MGLRGWRGACSYGAPARTGDSPAPVIGVELSTEPRYRLATVGPTITGPSYPRSVAYDEELADRIRDLLVGEAHVTEKKMFGGLAFLVGGNMAVAASGQGGLLARVDPAESDRLVQETPAEEMVMRGRAMAGWLRLDSADVATPKALAEWVARSVAYARSLPAK